MKLLKKFVWFHMNRWSVRNSEVIYPFNLDQDPGCGSCMGIVAGLIVGVIISRTWLELVLSIYLGFVFIWIVPGTINFLYNWANPENQRKSKKEYLSSFADADIDMHEDEDWLDEQLAEAAEHWRQEVENGN